MRRQRQWSAAQERALRRRVRSALVEQRLSLGLLQDEAARLAGLNRGQLAHIEHGVRLPSIDQLYKLARAYRCNPKGLLP
jgi:transcriptional regulator with XRE-family HTH domain